MEVKINTPYIKLDQLLKFAGIASSGSEAKFLISEELVLLNGQIENQRGKKIIIGDTVEVKGNEKILILGE